MSNLQSQDHMKNQNQNKQQNHSSSKRAESNSHNQNQIIQHRVPPSLLRVYADNQDKKTLFIVWGTFFFIVILVAILTVALPQSTQIRNLKDQLQGSYLQNCLYPVNWDSDKRVQCGKFDPSKGNKTVSYILNDIGKASQFAFFFVTFHLKNSSAGLSTMLNYLFIDISQSAQLFYSQLQKQLIGGSDTSFYFIQKGNNEVQDFNFKLNSQQSLNDNGSYTTLIALDRYFSWNYLILFLSFSDASQLTNIDSITWEVTTVNPKFTVFAITLRYVFFVIAIISFAFYLIQFIRIPNGQRVVQQKLILALGVLIILFNDPWYPITIFVPNGFSNFLSVFLVVNFVIFLVLFWIIMFDRIHFQKAQKDTQVVKWYKVGYVGILYVFTLILYLNYAYHHLSTSPILPTDQIISGRFLALQIITIIVALLGFIYIFIRYIQICAKMEQKLYRHQLFSYFSLFFIILMIVMYIIGGMQVFDFAQERILIFYTGMNLYVFYLARMFTVTSQQLQQVSKGYKISSHDRFVQMDLKQEDIEIDLGDKNYNNLISKRQQDDNFSIQMQQKFKIQDSPQKKKTHKSYSNQINNEYKSNGTSEVPYLKEQDQQLKVKNVIKRQVKYQIQAQKNQQRIKKQQKIDFFKKKSEDSNKSDEKQKQKNDEFNKFDQIQEDSYNQKKDINDNEQPEKQENQQGFQPFQI